MNMLRNTAVITGFVFIVFIIILAIADFSSLILVMGLIAVIAVISGSVKVMLLAAKRREVKMQIIEFQENRIKELKKEIPKDTRKRMYYCPVCLSQFDDNTGRCPECKKGSLVRSGSK
jgi:c-di-AMP phosphodiesterase-like protein